MSFKKLNNIVGWFVFLIATIVYFLTLETTVSWWDCGEYISTAYKLQVGHPPGAPLFQMLGRFFSLFAFGDVTKVALMMNAMSALCSSFTILFLFWTITLLSKKLWLKDGEAAPMSNKIAVLATGAVGALAYTFSDTFWFSAVESEVYAMSSLFTAITFWAILGTGVDCAFDQNFFCPGRIFYPVQCAFAGIAQSRSERAGKIPEFADPSVRMECPFY